MSKLESVYRTEDEEARERVRHECALCGKSVEGRKAWSSDDRRTSWISVDYEEADTILEYAKGPLSKKSICGKCLDDLVDGTHPTWEMPLREKEKPCAHS